MEMEKEKILLELFGNPEKKNYLCRVRQIVGLILLRTKTYTNHETE